MELTYLLVGLGAFMLARKANAPTTGSGVGVGGGGGTTSPPTGDRAALIASIYDGSIPGLDYVRYAFTISEPESGGKYRPFNQRAADKGYPLGMNQIGYSGMYQMGAPALETVGYIKAGTWRTPGTGGHYEILTSTNPSYWTDKCPGGLEQFMNTPEIQERAMLAMTKGNYRGLKSNGVLTDSSPPDVKAGYLAAAHISGVGGAVALAEGAVTRDGNGTPNDSYYRLGAGSQAFV